MPKSDALPIILPQVGSSDLRGLTLYELFHRQEMNDRNIELLKGWLNDIQNPVTYDYWVQFDKLRKKLIWAIRLKRLKNYLFSLVSRNQ